MEDECTPTMVGIIYAVCFGCNQRNTERIIFMQGKLMHNLPLLRTYVDGTWTWFTGTLLGKKAGNSLVQNTGGWRLLTITGNLSNLISPIQPRSEDSIQRQSRQPAFILLQISPQKAVRRNNIDKRSRRSSIWGWRNWEEWRNRGYGRIKRCHGTR